MKKIRLYCASLFAVLPLFTCGVKTDGIRQITKPYEGTYLAEKVLWGEDDVMPLLKDLKIALSEGGRLLVTYKQGFKTQSHELRYKIDDGKLYVGDKESGEENWKEATYEKGKIYLTMPIGNKTLHAVFGR